MLASTTGLYSINQFLRKFLDSSNPLDQSYRHEDLKGVLRSYLYTVHNVEDLYELLSQTIHIDTYQLPQHRNNFAQEFNSLFRKFLEYDEYSINLENKKFLLLMHAISHASPKHSVPIDTLLDLTLYRAIYGNDEILEIFVELIDLILKDTPYLNYLPKLLVNSLLKGNTKPIVLNIRLYHYELDMYKQQWFEVGNAEEYNQFRSYLETRVINYDQIIDLTY
jgi:hypothetical protein